MDAAADQPQVRRCECRTTLRGRDSAFAPIRAAAGPGKKDGYTFARTRQSLSQKAEPGCTGSLFCCLLWRESVRALRVFEPVFWSLLVDLLDNVLLQRDYAAAHVGSCFPTQLGE